MDFKEEYYGINGCESSNKATPIDFVDFFPVFINDAGNLKNHRYQIKVDFNAAIPAYAVRISDRLLYKESDGSKCSLEKRT